MSDETSVTPTRYSQGRVQVFGEHDGATVAQMHECMKTGNALMGVLCADGHLGYAQPVGGVIAYQDQISVSGVGFDIACGNLAVRTDVPFHAVMDRADELLAEIRKHISFGVGRVNNERVEHAVLDDDEAWKLSGVGEFRDLAASQLGTVGSGNHYVDLMVDVTGIDNPSFGINFEDRSIWIGIHFGSRGLGHKTATKFLKLGGGKDGMHVAPTVLDVNSDLGRQYIAAMQLAGRYAYAGREWVAQRVLKIIGGRALFEVHNHHNFAWHEEHDGPPVWVVRKGATPAFPGQLGFVGGSMGDDAVILEGVESEASRNALYSTVHGAGRLFGRKEAKRRFTREEMDAWLKERRVHVSGGDLDESPMAYRRLPDVLAHHHDMVRVKHTLRPFAVAMAGAGEYDPFRD